MISPLTEDERQRMVDSMGQVAMVCVIGSLLALMALGWIWLEVLL